MRANMNMDVAPNIFVIYIFGGFGRFGGSVSAILVHAISDAGLCFRGHTQNTTFLTGLKCT
jgi:hypothetical protein